MIDNYHQNPNSPGIDPIPGWIRRFGSTADELHSRKRLFELEEQSNGTQNGRADGFSFDFSRQFRTGGGRASLMRSKDNETRIKAAKLSHQPQLPSSHRQKPARKCRTGPTLQLSGSHAVRKERIPLRRRPTNARVLHKSKHDTSEALGAAANQRGDPPERHRMQPIGGEYAAA
ncbi:hypothetical protein FQA47_016061 [Oryzias melastigma]|uniref:Uncharacterized protein n=1 Tax=Oryzias melastigma TaxID=30732 RepID=A0A834FP06_ORYME|nr:hypothetical protein FQA47_016061 [Oryzias melastigma]